MNPMECFSWYGLGDGSIGCCTFTGARCIGPAGCSDYRSRLATVSDGFGSTWPATCPRCGAPMQVVRPGDCRCSAECYRDKED